MGETSRVWTATAVLGQAATAGPTEDKAAQAADLLRRARLAMSENDLTTAESLIAKAESLDVQYGTFTMGDTPKKARRDLDRKRATSSPAKPSQLFSPLGSNKNQAAPAADPFAGRTNTPPAATAGSNQVTPLPKVETAGAVGALPAAGSTPLTQANPAALSTGGASPLNGAAPVTSLTPANGVPGGTANVSAARTNNSPLREARLALAFGDVRRATEMLQRARDKRISYQPTDDTPDKVEGAIRKYQELSTLDKNTEAYRRAFVRNMMEQGDALYRWGDFDDAERLASRAAGVPIEYGPTDQRPQELLKRLAAARRPGAAGTALSASRPGLTPAPGTQAASGVMPASAQFPVTTAAGVANDQNATRAVYDPTRDATRNVQAASQQSVPLVSQRQPTVAPRPGDSPQPPQVPADVVMPQQATKTPAMALYEQGEAALKAHDTERAQQLFQQAAAEPNELDPVTAQRLQDHLQLLSVAASKPQGGAPTMVDEAAAKQQLLHRQALADLSNQEAKARAMRETDPKGALVILQEAKTKVASCGLDATVRDSLVRHVDRAITETEQYIEQNRPQLDLAEKNDRTRQDVERERRSKVEIKEKIALKIDEFNRLMDEQKYEEAQVAAKQAADLDPKDPVVVQVLWQAKLARRLNQAKAIEADAEEGFVNAMGEVDRAKVPFASDKSPMVFADAKTWDNITKKRQKFGGDSKRLRTEREIDIEKKLRTPVSLQFKDVPLSTVMTNLANLADVNVVLDPQGLAEEAVLADTPVTINVQHEIMLKSALNLILQPLHLSYVVKDEVLKITSEQMRDGEVYKQVYNVADLVVPIPNFVPQPMGLQSALNGAMANVGMGGGGLPFASATATPMPVVSSHAGMGANSAINPEVLAQMGAATHPSGVSKNTPVGAGPGGLGGGAQADFDSLIDLITTTVKPTTWDSVGGPGSISQFDTNLSIVVSQTQDVHEEIVELLQQLRRLQDLQVTIEVRFITLNDSFFERIGVSFDFDIATNYNDSGVQIVSASGNNTGATTGASTTTTNRNKAITVGMSTPTTFSSDLDIPFTQNSYGLAVPKFGAFDASAGASLGFAILSDIEAYFFINAAQGNNRSNVLQAPKVTLFNGQQAYVSDTTSTPFVMSVVPVVGDFAAALQPVIVVLSEGTFMTVQAVVSADRRFVRMTVVPFFSNIGDVRTFQFSGASSTTTDSSREGLQASATDSDKLWNKKSDASTTTTSGTTVQLPSFSFVTVTTTVSVPDGGTVLLGGIKRLREGRQEAGVPGLDKIPYLNRLFRNQSIGRDTSSLMMMVTPRIIIQEEEEEALGVDLENP